MSTETTDYQRLIGPVLEVLVSTDTYFHINELSESLTDLLDFAALEHSQILPSGRQTVFENNLHWALSYLEQDRLIETDGDQQYRITGIGKQFLTTGLIEFTDNKSEPYRFFKKPEPSRHPQQDINPAIEMVENSAENVPDKTPQETIAVEFENVYLQLKKDVAKHIHARSPLFFETLIIDLLLAMGYGDRRRDLVAHLGRTGDGGIDGAIKQDQLGLDMVYVQAKRYRPGLSVPVSAVRDFAGALEAKKANKGVFVTTSHFTKSAYEFTAAVSSRIVLIDGERLSSLLIRNNIGVKIFETYEIKRIDEDYFQ